MSAPGAGFEYPAQDVSWTARDVLLFATSIGCTVNELHYLYELHPGFATFPTYAIILPFKGTETSVIDFYAKQNATSIPGVPKLDSRRVVDGQRQLTFHKPLPTSSEGRSFQVRSKVLGVYDKGKAGTVVETQQQIVDTASGEVYTTAVGQGFFTGQGNWGGPKGDKAPSYNPPAGKNPDATAVTQTRLEEAHLYRLNGDYNPLHATPEPGAKMGFGGAIMHGLYTWNVAAHSLLKELGGSKPENLKQFQARFASPVKPGDKLVTQIWRMGNADKDGFEEVRFVTSVEGGKACLSNGRALIKCVEKSKL